MKNLVQAVKGTRAFYPDQMKVRNWLYEKIRQISMQFGYEEYDGPFLEKIDLYAAKSGEELVKEQAFVFPDRGGDLITLRPELTPTLARMVAEKQNELIYPLRWWSFGPFWRYERPQKGRTREFFQWNIDLIGIDSPSADAELIGICALFLKYVGLNPDQVTIFVNHRQLINQEITNLGISDDVKKKVFKLIDRIEKMETQVWDGLVLEEGLSKKQLEKLKKLLNDQELWKKSEELTEIFGYLGDMGVSEYVRFNPKIIRGLDYYTKVVFEAWDIGRDGRAILGGGHYDNLVSDLGGDPLPGVGFAMGDVMISLILEKYGCFPQSNFREGTVLVTTFDESGQSLSIRIASELRESGIYAITYPQTAKLQKQLKFADKLGIKMVIMIGQSEIEANLVTIKNLATTAQVTVPKVEYIKVVKEILAQG
jgi:histidyl-tRNA synthetase